MSEAAKDDEAERKARYEAFMAEERARAAAKQERHHNGNVVPIKLDMTLGARARGIVAYPGPPRDEAKPPIAATTKAEEAASVKSAVAELAAKSGAEKSKALVPVSGDTPASAFSLRGNTFKDGRTPLEKSMAALRSLGVRFSYDRFRHQFFVGNQALQQWVGESIDHHILVLRTAVNERFGWEAKPEVTKAATFRLCLENSFNPVLNYFDGLVWDGKPRLDTWLSTYLGAADERLNRAIGRKTLIAAVRRARHAGTKFDQIVVLEGEQGTGKSTALMILATEDYHSDAEILGQSGREVMEQTTGVLIYEISELEGIGKRDVAHVKAFARRQFDRARPAYGHALEKRGRTCIFIGTTNSKDYLADETGNRTFWPIVTGAIDLDALARDRDQLWAEAVAAEVTGESLVIDKALWSEAAAVVGERLPDDPWQDILAKVENTPNAGGSLERADGYIKVTTEFLLDGVLGISREKVNQNHTKRLSRVMERLGWEKPPNIRIGTTVAKGYRKKIE
jgi:hypothetical protein